MTTAATLSAIDQSVVCHASVSLACVGSKIQDCSEEGTSQACPENLSVYLLQNYKNTSIKFNTEMPDYSWFAVEQPDWDHPCKEDIPVGIPEPKGKPVRMTTFFDANL